MASLSKSQFPSPDGKVVHQVDIVPLLDPISFQCSYSPTTSVLLYLLHPYMKHTLVSNSLYLITNDTKLLSLCNNVLQEDVFVSSIGPPANLVLVPAEFF
jgi:hypothetical protein